MTNEELVNYTTYINSEICFQENYVDCETGELKGIKEPLIKIEEPLINDEIKEPFNNKSIEKNKIYILIYVLMICMICVLIISYLYYKKIK